MVWPERLSSLLNSRLSMLLNHRLLHNIYLTQRLNVLLLRAESGRRIGTALLTDARLRVSLKVNFRVRRLMAAN